MNSERTTMAKGFAFGALAGGTIGALLALLYAPTSGKELRINLKEKTNKLLSEAEEILEKAKTRASTSVGEAKKKLAEEKSRLQDVVYADFDAYEQEGHHFENKTECQLCY
jgi:gas vesicle protein